MRRGYPPPLVLADRSRVFLGVFEAQTDLLMQPLDMTINDLKSQYNTYLSYL
jgi:hypothetical protein